MDAQLSTLRFDDPALSSTFAHYRGIVDVRQASLAGIEADLMPYCGKEPYAECVRRLCAYPGIAALGASSVSSGRKMPMEIVLVDVHAEVRQRAMRESGHRPAPSCVWQLPPKGG